MIITPQGQKHTSGDSLPQVPLKLDFVRVGGRYRVRKLLGSGGSGEPNSEISHFSDTSLLIPL